MMWISADFDMSVKAYNKAENITTTCEIFAPRLLRLFSLQKMSEGF